MCWLIVGDDCVLEIDSSIVGYLDGVVELFAKFDDLLVSSFLDLDRRSLWLFWS